MLPKYWNQSKKFVHCGLILKGCSAWSTWSWNSVWFLVAMLPSQVCWRGEYMHGCLHFDTCILSPQCMRQGALACWLFDVCLTFSPNSLWLVHAIGTTTTIPTTTTTTTTSKATDEWACVVLLLAWPWSRVPRNASKVGLLGLPIREKCIFVHCLEIPVVSQQHRVGKQKIKTKQGAKNACRNLSSRPKAKLKEAVFVGSSWENVVSKKIGQWGRLHFDWMRGCENSKQVQLYPEVQCAEEPRRSRDGKLPNDDI